MSEQYNGWANYETQLAHLWLTNEQGTYELYRELLWEHAELEHSPYKVADAVKELFWEIYVDGQIPEGGILHDIVHAFHCTVNWLDFVESDYKEVLEEVN